MNYQVFVFSFCYVFICGLINCKFFYHSEDAVKILCHKIADMFLAWKIWNSKEYQPKEWKETCCFWMQKNYDCLSSLTLHLTFPSFVKFPTSSYMTMQKFDQSKKVKSVLLQLWCKATVMWQFGEKLASLPLFLIISFCSKTS